VSIADKLRDLHTFATDYTSIIPPDVWYRSSKRAVDLLPEIAAVIEAAEKYINTLDMSGMADDTPIAEALAALARRLEQT